MTRRIAGLDRVEPVVPAFDHVRVLARPAEIAEQPDALRELLVVGRHRAAVAVRAEVLARVEAEGGGPPEAADPASLVAGAVRLARVLDEGEAVLAQSSSSGSMSAGWP